MFDLPAFERLYCTAKESADYRYSLYQEQLLEIQTKDLPGQMLSAYQSQ